MINIEIFWDDLTKAKQDEIREALNMDANDNGNWDVFPIATLYFEEETND